MLAGLDEGIRSATDDRLRRSLQQEFNAIAAELKRQEGTLRDYLQQTGLRRDSTRVQVTGFGRSEAQKAVHGAKKALTNAEGHPIIEVNRVTIKGEPGTITQIMRKNGGIDRNYYDASGRQIKQISNNDHGSPKMHPYGEHEEHAHDYIWDDDAVIDRPRRELTA